MRDVHGLVADALEVAVDARNRQQKAQVAGHRRVQREQALHAVVDFDLHLVDGVFLGENRLGEALLRLEQPLNRLVDGSLRETPHPKQPLLQFLKIVCKVAFQMFHRPFGAHWPSHHPNRPVM